MREGGRPATVRGVTLNLAGLRYAWYPDRFRAVIRGLEALSLDVACFQEAAVRRGHEPYNQAAAVGQALGLPFVAFAPYGNPIESASLEVGGVAIVSRWPIAYVETIRLPESGTDPPDNRVALLVKLLAPTGELSVATTHLAWRPEQEDLRTRQLGVILAYLRDLGLCRPDAPLVFAGDLNAAEGEPALDLANRLLQDCFRACKPDIPGTTWSHANPLAFGPGLPDRRLDYAFCPAGMHVREARVVLDRPDPVYPSDHFGLYVAVDLATVGSGTDAQRPR